MILAMEVLNRTEFNPLELMVLFLALMSRSTKISLSSYDNVLSYNKAY